MNIEDRKVYVDARAVELAQSGKHSDYQSIEHAIRREGYPEARHWLDRCDFRDYLNTLCQKAKKKQGEI
jgi:hypothetical protein